ncbi:MAG: hypothetical protein K6T85_02800 [Gorillibacterium sp.]|nr:hypothetical protein [Gorillibacterium sp.]
MRSMALTIEELQILITTKTTGLKQSLSEVTKRLGATDKEVKRTTASVSKTIKAIPAPTIKTTALSRDLTTVRQRVSSATKGVSSALSSLKGARGIGGVMSSLGGLTSALGPATAGLTGLGAGAAGASAALGPVGLALAAVVVALGVFVAVVFKASQEAVRYESALGRVNMQLKGGTRDYMQWARAQGLAKSSAADMGATYSVLLSAFTNDQNALRDQTKQLVQTTRVVASATGRTIEDTTERIRSGLLGNTEAIEDLGVFVNVSMIESTKAFKKFANGKHWDQLDFRTQQQIRLQAILEQSYDRYGDKLQNNVMTKQTLLMEQLKDIKLNMSQAFLPIWDAILPALTALAEKLAYVTEQIARFVYWLRGWDYDERTQGLDQQTGAVADQGKAYDNLADSAKKAKSELAGFDQLNLLGDTGAGSGAGGSGSGAVPNAPSNGGSGGNGLNLPDIPTLIKTKWQFDIEWPDIDAGLGAVVTYVTSTVNSLIADTKKLLDQMWEGLRGQTQAGLSLQRGLLDAFAGGITGALLPAMIASITAQLASMWATLQAQTALGGSTVRSSFAGTLANMLADLLAWSPQLGANWASHWANLQTQTVTGGATVRTSWRSTLNEMLADFASFRTSFSPNWSALKSEILSIQNPFSTVRLDWTSTLQHMQTQLATYQPGLILGWGLLGAGVLAIKSPLAEVRQEWANTMTSMQLNTLTALGGILKAIDAVMTAWDKLKQALTGAVSSVGASAGSWLSGMGDFAKNAVSAETLSGIWDMIKGEAARPVNQIGAAVVGGAVVAPALGAAGIGAEAGAAIKSLIEMLKGFGIAVPAFAGGALAFGPTLAMVGDNRGAATDPEVIAPISMLSEYMDGGSDNRETVSVLRKIQKAIEQGQNVQVTIARDAIGGAAVAYLKDESRRGINPLDGVI